MGKLEDYIFLEKLEKHLLGCKDIETLEKNICCVDGKIIGTGRADYTQGATGYHFVINGKRIELIDIPGIEGDESLYEECIQDSLERAHIIFYVNGNSKKIENTTLEKIKKYMRDGTSVYALFNVHCKPKKSRIIGIDKTYCEELSAAYENQRDIVEQTERELKSFLDSNFCGSIMLNGLLSFCSLAINKNGSTTIVDDQDKNLRKDQSKYLNEYANDINRMIVDSNIEFLKNLIYIKSKEFEGLIYKENIKKLNSKLENVINQVENLRTSEIEKIRGFSKGYDDLDEKCFYAKEQYIHSIKHIGGAAVEKSFEEVKNELFSIVEQDKGNTKLSKVESVFSQHREKIIANIQEDINKRFETAQEQYENEISVAQQSMIKDMERVQTKFKISMELSGNDSINPDFLKELQYSLSDFGKHLSSIGSFAFSGFSLGTLIPGIGNLAGTIIGAIAGIFNAFINFFSSEQTRINRAKEKLQFAIDDQIDHITDHVNKAVKDTNYEEMINKSYEQIHNMNEKQKMSLWKAEIMLNNVLSDLRKQQKEIN